MARPIWTFLNSDLGSITESDYFRLPLTATNAVDYRVISGNLPPGLQVSRAGILQGIPVIATAGVEDSVYSYRFVVRASSSAGEIADRSFTIKVVNIKVPQIVGPESNLGSFTEGEFVDIQLEGMDNTPSDLLTYTIISGELPNANLNNDYRLTMSSSGRLSGYILALDQPSEVFEFTVEVSDGVNASRKTYSLTAIQAGAFRRPILLTTPAEVTPTKHDNFYNFKFEAYDFDGDPLTFRLVNRLDDSVLTGERGFDSVPYDEFGLDETVSSIASNLTLDPDTGWLYGQLPIVNRFAIYEFEIEVVKAVSPGTTSRSKRFVLRVNELDTVDVVWSTDSNLGSIFNGEVSTLSVEAVSPTDSSLNYRLLPYDPADPYPVRLPQGLVLTDQGLLIGRPTFRFFSLDNNETTVSDQGTTTYDEAFRFTVEARDSYDDNLVSERSIKTFVIRVLQRNPVPYENVYLQALLPSDRRSVYRNLISATDWLPQNTVYRSSDPNFGRQLNLKLLFLPGVEADFLSRYVNATEFNHYRKKLKLLNLNLAVAKNENFEPIYEVIYASVDDDREQNQASIQAEVDLIGLLSNYYKINGENQTKFYPNSLRNMKARLLEFLTQERRGVLPRWMVTVQDDGSVPGLINAIPLAYVRPGTGAVALQNLQNKITNELDTLSEFNFEIDRYQVDQHLSRYWNADTNSFIPSRETTFDRFSAGRRALTLAGTVDFAVSVPFDSLNNANLLQLQGYSDPEIVSEQVFPVSSVSWTTWMNNNAVWRNAGASYFYGEVFVIERDFYVETAGNYTVYLMNSDTTSVSIDGLTVFNNIATNITNDENNTKVDVYLSTGNHTIIIRMSVETNVSTLIQIWSLNPRGVALEIKDSSTTVFNTQSNYEPKVNYLTRTLEPGIDGVSDIRTGQTLIFARQSDYENYEGENHGWNLVTELYGVGYDVTGIGFNQSTVVPGLNEQQTDILDSVPTPRDNERAGIWTVNVDQNLTVTLDFTTPVEPFETVIVRNGDTYRDTILYLRDTPLPGESELSYEALAETITVATIFDGGDTRFLDYRDLYVDPGRGDKYVIYPKLGVFE